MTREEQIIEAGTYHLCGSRPLKTYGHNMHELAYINRNLVFEAGAKWADENPKEGLVSIDKACEYLESAIRPYMGYSATCDFVDTFRKVMEK